MTDGIGTPQDFIAQNSIAYDCGRLFPLLLSRTVSGAGALALGALAAAVMLYARPTAAPNVDEVPASLPAAHVIAKTRNVYGTLVGEFAAHVAAKTRNVYGTLAGVSAAAVSAQNTSVYGTLAAFSAAPASASATTESANVPAPPVPAAPQSVPNVPLPPPRPFGGSLLANHVPLRGSGRLLAHAEALPPVPATIASDHRSFFDKMFGIAKASGGSGQALAQAPAQALAYAMPEVGLFSAGRRDRSAAVLPYGRDAAVYDIAAHTVYMPDGTKLEAHSGLGSELDDPHRVNHKMRGATPPNVYELKLRETLFHGVQALRLIPVGTGDVFGRTGLLAHTYMLGPNGQSNGCVSFRNYNAFLQAYMKGEVKRLVVVAGLN